MISSFIYMIFWLGFLLVHQLEAASITVKSCPSTQPPECPPELYKECNVDQDCDTRYPGKGLKCCNQCGWSCVTPVVTKVQGTTTPKKPKSVNIITKLVAKCPTKPPSSDFTPGPDHECQNDASCDTKYPGQDLKCCQDGCEFRCISPVVESVIQPFVRPGTCPLTSYRPPYLTWTCRNIQRNNECEGDENCEQLHPGSGLKCCQSGCHKACLAPVESSPGSVVPGICPVFPEAAECPLEPDDECDSDLKCNELNPGLGLKCCIDGCDYRCVPPVKTSQGSVVPGICPVFPEAADCPPEPDDECDSDLKCNELNPGLGLKCCIDGCEYRCVPPVKTSQGSVVPVCPALPEAVECPPEPDDECDSDLKCNELNPGLGLKCCSDGCEYRCLPPVSG